MVNIKEKNTLSIVIGLIFFFLACGAFFSVSKVLTSFISIIAIACLLKGIISLLESNKNKNLSQDSIVWMKTSSLIDIHFSLLLLLNLKLGLLNGSFIGFLFAIWILSDSMTRFMLFKQVKNRQGIVVVISKLLILFEILLGFILLISPWQSVNQVSIVIAMYFFVLSISKGVEGVL